MFLRRAKLGAQAVQIRATTDVYTELEWLRTNGQQCIRTSLKCNRDTVIELEHQSIFSGYAIPIISDCADDGTSSVYICRSRSGVTSTFGYATATPGQFFSYENVIVNKDCISISGYETSYNTEVEEFTSGDIYLFTNPTVGYGTYYSYIYNVKFTIDNVLYEIIPVLDEEGTPCMYNKATREFYYNIGSGDFTYSMKGSEE